MSRILTKFGTNNLHMPEIKKEEKLNQRVAQVLPYDEGFATLTFLKPHSGEHENHLIVVYEDAYGDFSTGMMQKSTIQERYKLPEETLNDIFNTLL